jgi:hypothetical protein
MDHFIIFELFYQLQFFISLGQIIFKLVYPKINLFDTIFNNLQVYLVMFIQMDQFELKSGLFHPRLVEWLVKILCRSLFAKLNYLNTFYFLFGIYLVGLFLGGGG